MVVIGVWILILASLLVASLYAVVNILITHQVIRLFAIVIMLFLVACALEITLLMILRSRVTTYKNFWAVKSTPISNEFIYVALGDSAAQGIGASSPDLSYVKLIAAQVESRTSKRVRIINLSRSGAKLNDLLSSQIPEMRGLNPDIVTVDIGSNDIAGGTSQDIMSREYDQAIKALSPYPVIFSNLPDFMWGTQQRDTTVMNNTILKLCNDHSIKQADLHAFTHSRMWSFNEFAADGFHPNNNGHRTWARSFAPGVEAIIALSVMK